jgi:hypothetical protein
LEGVTGAKELEVLRPLGRQRSAAIEADGPLLAAKPSTLSFFFDTRRLAGVAITPRFEANHASISASVAALAGLAKSPSECGMTPEAAVQQRVSCSWSIGQINYEISGSGPISDFSLTLWITSTAPLPPPIRLPMPASVGPTRPTLAASGWLRRVETDDYSGARSITWRARMTPISRDGFGHGPPILVLSCSGSEPSASLSFSGFGPPPIITYTFGTRFGADEPTEYAFEYAADNWLDMTWKENENWAGMLFWDAITLSHPIITSLTNDFNGGVTRYRIGAVPVAALRDLTPCAPEPEE